MKQSLHCSSPLPVVCCQIILLDKEKKMAMWLFGGSPGHLKEGGGAWVQGGKYDHSTKKFDTLTTTINTHTDRRLEANTYCRKLFLPKILFSFAHWNLKWQSLHITITNSRRQFLIQSKNLNYSLIGRTHDKSPYSRNLERLYLLSLPPPTIHSMMALYPPLYTINDVINRWSWL